MPVVRTIYNGTYSFLDDPYLECKPQKCNKKYGYKEILFLHRRWQNNSNTKK